ncbi:MAG: MBOAT family protein [Verrucomicrobia bacterium]|nr:MBOAT family protein [Verrucomicrobiota bacterium]
MLFNSNTFLLFFALFYLAYLPLRKSVGLRNALILLGSLIFYGSWSVPFLGLLLFTASTDFGLALLIHRVKSGGYRRLLLIGSLALNLGILGYFKYAGFALELWADLLNAFHQESTARVFAVILPVGISFYVFQSIGYVFDVYRGLIPPERNWIKFLSFVSFFPQLVAGPIERAPRLAPQFSVRQEITVSGCAEAVWLLLWGFFKKVVIADNLAAYVDLVFGQETFAPGLYALATVAFGIQIYCDFSGYSDIARGLAKLLGFDIIFNFNLPYFARDLREFWGRWHISLSTWFRDYLYIPLGGNRRGLDRTCQNLLAVMAIAGLWHGAGWPFVLWGAWLGLGLVVNHLWRAAALPSPGWAASWFVTMLVVFLGWFLFRARSLEQIYAVVCLNGGTEMPFWTWFYVRGVLTFAAPLVLVETIQFLRNDRLWPTKLPFLAQSVFYGALAAFVVSYWNQEGTPFIYFQF